MASFYIPRMSIEHTEYSVAYTFAANYVGEVKRVDFVPLETPNNDRFCSAFVHCYHANPSLLAFMDEMEGQPGYRLQINSCEYWILLKNKNPIPDTRLNIHQVVENARLLEQRVEEQNEVIERQSEEISRIHDTIYRLMTTVYSLDEDKKRLWGNYNYMVYGEYFDDHMLIEEDFEPLEIEEKNQRKIEKIADKALHKDRKSSW